jgi:hypothetical protein
MGVDEKLHWKRGLGRWERLGHPLDSLTVLIPMSLISLTTVTKPLLSAYVVLSAFSCLFITKDEFIHSKECSPFENWLHAVLFIIHPMIFFTSGILWIYHPNDQLLKYQPLLVGMFMLYQVVKWSIPWKQQTK